jgi:hypothetical protein
MYKLKHLSTIGISIVLSSVAYAEIPLNTTSPLPLNLMEVKKISENKTLIDPTEPVDIGAPSKKSGNKLEKTKIRSLNVQIISYQSNGGSFVVINGKRFMEGDAFDESTIKKIEKNKVILSNPARKPLVLEYANLSIKKSEGRNQ